MRLLIVGLLLTSGYVHAQSGLILGRPAYGGTGCPAGTASVTLSPDHDAISILFDQFVTEAGSTTGRRVDRKSCNLSVPVKVPQGYSVSVFKTDYRGYNLVPESGAYNRLDTEYFWAGVRGPRFRKIYSGPINENYTQSNGIIVNAIVWTPCGASVTLRVNSSIMSQSNPQMDETMMTVDSADISSGFIYHIQWRRCG
ncbi:MAG: DUF4360 domain-containing protein [Bdellovibrionaceae bacterium]|nr:DUF4360 domain-containing protein [Pseudobdellovibrionaceae bacterium]